MIHYRLATPQDNAQLMALTAAADMAGDVSFRIDRQPDFFQLLRMRGESKVFVALEGKSIIGSLSVSTQKVYVGGEIFPIQYIGDFKVAKAYRNKSVGANLCNELAEYVVSIDADLAFLDVSMGNSKPFSFFKDRPGFPDFENIGVFSIHQFVGRKQKLKSLPFSIKTEEATAELIAFLNAHFSAYELGPFITGESLEGAEIFTIRREEKIVAAMCLTDTMKVKQNIVTRLSWSKKYLLQMMNAVSGCVGISKMPSLHAPVQMIYIKYMAVHTYDRQMIKAMVSHAQNIVYERAYSFASIGLHEKDPLNASISGLFKLTFRSVGMLISLKNNVDIIDKVVNGIPYEDYSLV